MATFRSTLRASVLTLTAAAAISVAAAPQTAADGAPAPGALLVAAPAPAPAPALAPSAGGAPTPAPASAPAPGLLAIVPADCTRVWHKAADAGTAFLEEQLLAVGDAVLSARFDELVLDLLEGAGAPADLLAELRSKRNVAVAVSGVVPWRELLAHELVYAESVRPAFGGETGLPGLLLAARPAPERSAQLERGLAALFGSLALGSPLHLRYDVEERAGADGRASAVHALRFPADPAITVLQMTSRDGALLLGVGGELFDAALALLGGGDGPRLVATPRYVHAFGELPADAPWRRFVDVRGMSAGLRDVSGLLASRDFAAGLWPALLGDALDVFRHVDTVASTLACRDGLLVVETLTRFDGAAPADARGHPLYRAAIPAPAAAELLDFVPAEAHGFTLRGRVELAPAYTAALERLAARWELAGELLWGARVLGAAADFSVERDLLSWLGDEHVSITLPRGARAGASGSGETVVLWRLDDPAGAAKCLARLEALARTAGPDALAAIQRLLAQIDAPFVPEVRLAVGAGSYPWLRRVDVTGLPFPTPPLHYGVLGRTLVVTTSEAALEACLAAAAGDREGLAQHPLAARLVGRGDLSSAELRSYGDALSSARRMVVAAGGVLNAVLARFVAGQPERAWIVDGIGGLVARVDDVLGAVDFLGEGVRWGERREGGLAYYEGAAIELVDRRAAARGGPATSRGAALR